MGFTRSARSESFTTSGSGLSLRRLPGTYKDYHLLKIFFSNRNRIPTVDICVEALEHATSCISALWKAFHPSFPCGLVSHLLQSDTLGSTTSVVVTRTWDNQTGWRMDPLCKLARDLMSLHLQWLAPFLLWQLRQHTPSRAKITREKQDYSLLSALTEVSHLPWR